MNKALDSLLTEVSQCTKCPKLEPWRKFPTNVHGNTSARAMIVSEAPGCKSIRRGKFWMGQAGRRIRKVISNFAVQLEDVFYLTDTVKCNPPDDRTPYPDEIENCKGFLTRGIQILKPSFILVFGKIALSYFLSHFTPKLPFKFQSMDEVQNDDGYRLIEFDNFTLIPLLHPSRANQFMSYDNYTQHLAEIFAMIINDTKDSTTTGQNGA